MVSREITINAPAAFVWAIVSDPTEIGKWIAESDGRVETNWRVGDPIVITGNLHGILFEHVGRVLVFEPLRRLKYDYHTRLTSLPEIPESYSEVEICVEDEGLSSRLRIIQTTFSDAATWKHADLYWNVTAEIIRKICETRSEEYFD